VPDLEAKVSALPQSTHIMRTGITLFAASGLLSSVFAAPAPAPNRVKPRQESAVQFFDNTNNPTATPFGPSGASGSLRGGSELLGFNPTNVISSYNPGVVASSAFSVGPLQTADADTGFYLDLSKIENPQPIRGAGGKTPTDPGPRNELLEKQNPDLYIPPVSFECNLLIMIVSDHCVCRVPMLAM
jgi:hypothetical protein